MSLKTNIIRIQAYGNCYMYSTIQQNNLQQLSVQDVIQIQQYFENLDSNVVYAHPFLYAHEVINVESVEILLARGISVKINIQFLKEVSKIQILGVIANKMGRSLNFVHYRAKQIFFNPFEQKDGVMPGLSVSPIHEPSYSGIVVLPQNLLLQPPISISSSKILLNYRKGMFYQRNQIVRVDKQKNLIHFRSGESVSISDLRKGNIQDIVGYELADRLRNYAQRIKEVNSQFFKNWNIVLEGQFFGVPGSLVSVGGIVLRDGKERALSDLVAPMARNVYNHSYRELFKTPFQSDLQAQLVFLIPSNLSKPSKQLLHQYQKLSQQMGLRLKLSHTTLPIQHHSFTSSFTSTSTSAQLQKLLSSTCTSTSSIYILITSQDPKASAQTECLKYFKQVVIQRQLYFHIVYISVDKQNRENKDKDDGEFDVLALRNLAVLYCKLRKIPWKIKNIPFGNRPTVAVSVDVRDTDDGRFSVAVVATMNAFFSKFCCSISACENDRIPYTIFTLLQKSLNRFLQAHKIYPVRIFLYRTGQMMEIESEHKYLKEQLRAMGNSMNITSSLCLTYIQLVASHPFRLYVQSDENNLSRLTVKKTQLMTYTMISGKHYLQLEFKGGPLEIRLLDNEQDPTFLPKVLELTGKLCFGSVGNEFGKGLGMLGFGEKLNEYREMNLQRWQKYLEQGVMLFL